MIYGNRKIHHIFFFQFTKTQNVIILRRYFANIVAVINTLYILLHNTYENSSSFYKELIENLTMS